MQTTFKHSIWFHLLQPFGLEGGGNGSEKPAEPLTVNGEAAAATVRERAVSGKAFYPERYGNVHKANLLSDSLRGADADREQRPSRVSHGPLNETMPPRSRNLFLSSLSPASRQLLVSRSTPVALRHKMRLFKPEQRPTYAYFVTEGIASVVTEMADGAMAEVAMTGREGIAGALHILGPVIAPTHCFVQMEGTALRIPLAGLRTIFHDSEEIRDAILKLVQKEAMVLSQVAGCHRLHSAEERLARWLLMAQDQTRTDDLHFTQALLANMLGARRATVTEVAGALQRKGLIQYHRGHVIIRDRDGLERVACQCYQVIKELRGDIYHMS